MNAATFGKMIRKLRKKIGLTQTELAQRLNVTDKAVSKWENGGGYPEITLLPILAELFGVSVDYMLKGNPRGIAVAGNIIVDVINIIDKYPQKNMQANILRTKNAVGGCVSNTTINLAKIDPSLFLTAYGKVGNDEPGRYVLSQMQRYGIDVSHIKISDSQPTGCSHVMTEEKSGDRTFFCTRGANSEFDIPDINLLSLDCEIFHIGYIMLLDMLDTSEDSCGTRMAKLLHDLSGRGIKTSIDVIGAENEHFAEKVIPALQYCNFAIMNEAESCSIAGLSPRNCDGNINMENIKAGMEVLMRFGVKDKVIVHCSEAGMMLDSSGKFTAVPSLCLPDGYIKGSVGAGDAFAAGCLYGIYNGYDGEQLLKFAASAAACSLSESDSISGMKSKKEIEKLEKQYPPKQILL